ncbi:MAG: tRNA pseudouridine(55) synthase TruB [Chitinophagales bacterium]|nr:tRNA pseudouridine(55) synthase TruB [Chitinophagales bacterium]
MTFADILNGSILLFDKPFDWSSFDVVKKVKRLTGAKVGHAGTLDPYATGLLILCTQQLTKKISEIQNKEKEYTGTLTLGKSTPSYDMETEADQYFDTSHITEELIRKMAIQYQGEILQSPPIYSAAMVDGKRAYKKARRGDVFELKKRLVQVHEFEIIEIEMPKVHFRIICAKGFYVRSLANDFGKSLDSGAYLSSLCRTRIGEYHLKDAWQITDFASFVDKEKSLS